MATPLPVRDQTEWKGVNFELLFATEVLRLRALHYGYWDTPPSAPVDLASLRLAQERFTRKLLCFVPDTAASVLDVGAGIGEMSRALAEQGLRVTALSPDRNHARYFVPLRRLGVAFHQVRFENFESARRFDVVLISEALNYFNREVGLEQCRRLICPGGHLLVAAMFRFRDHRPWAESFRGADLPYVEAAGKFGFSLIDEQDITREVAPTMQLARRAVERYLIPVLKAGEATARRLFWKRGAEKAREVREYYAIRTDPAYFLRSVRYAILLFQRDAAS